MSTQITPPGRLTGNPPAAPRGRDSNLELYRIIVMLLIVAHHYVVNSGLSGKIIDYPFAPVSCAMLLFGAWGKTGINCFVLITGWFMCRSTFKWQKFIKLYAQIIFYAVIIYAVFCITGHETFSLTGALYKLLPVKSIADGFTSCFLVFYLCIPFINILLQNMNKKQHQALALLLLCVFTILPSFPRFRISFNYVEWFIVLYIFAAYMRNYGADLKISHSAWGWIALAGIFAASASVLILFALYKYGYMHNFIGYFFVSDSNKILALFVALASFMWFKDLHIPQSRFINAVGGATFGVLLIHANSDAMRQWLWRETVDCTGHFSDNLPWTLGYAAAAVLTVFIVCAGIDWIRGKLIDEHINKMSSRK